MFESCLEKQQHLLALFDTCRSTEARYEKIIELGRQLPLFDSKYKLPEYLVHGCQSQMYLRTEAREDKLFFTAVSDALISAGLAAILLIVYSEESAETILGCPPNYLEKLGLKTSLTPSRSNGLYSIHLRMKQEALRFLTQASSRIPL